MTLQERADRVAVAATAPVTLALLALAAGLSAAGVGPVLLASVGFYAALLAAAALVSLRPVRQAEERPAWALFALGTALWVGGEVFIGLALDRAERELPSVADACRLGAYLLYGIGLALLLRSRLARVRAAFWLDGLIVALAVAALFAAVLVQPVLGADDGDAAATLTRLAYPVCGAVLLALVAGALGVNGARRSRTWLLLGAGLTLLVLADAFYVLQSVSGAYRPGGLLDVLWPAGLVLVGLAACSGGLSRGPAERPLPAVPVAGALAALAVVTAGTVAEVGSAAVALSALALAAVVARLLVSFREIDGLLSRTRVEADTDVLTELPNRRKLLADLDRLIEQATADEPVLLALFDLDGFKAYNDAFGHPAGDLLLARLGERLARVVTDRGVAYRLGGDEFCLLASAGAAEAQGLLRLALGALQESGAGFRVSASYGRVTLPAEAADVRAAIRLADERLYTEKRRRRSERERAHEPLLQALYERAPRLRDHVDRVVDLALAVGAEVRLDAAERADLELAARLHDIGKLAVPDEILAKEGPLDEREWEFIRQHPLVGERILAASPTLAGIGAVVRATHERWDGTGYPGGLAREEIPLAARIIAVCDAAHSMVEHRPYQGPLDLPEALAELKRCAGSQFDPDVVDALLAVVRRFGLASVLAGDLSRSAA